MTALELVETDDEPLAWCDDCEGEALVLIDLGTSRELSCGHLQVGVEADEDGLGVLDNELATHSMHCYICGEEVTMRLLLHPVTRQADFHLVCGHDIPWGYGE